METSRTLTTGNATAKRAAAILVDKQIGFMIPTAKQRQNLLIAFVKKNMVVYGRAFDIVKLLGDVDLNDLASVEKNLDKNKSTKLSPRARNSLLISQNTSLASPLPRCWSLKVSKVISNSFL